MTTPELRRRLDDAEQSLKWTRKRRRRARYRAWQEDEFGWSRFVGVVDALKDTGVVPPYVEPPPDCAMDHKWDNLCEACAQWAQSVHEGIEHVASLKNRRPSNDQWDDIDDNPDEEMRADA